MLQRVGLASLCALAGPTAAQDPPMFDSDEFVVVLTPAARGSINVAAGPTVNIASIQNIITGIEGQGD